MASSRRDAAAPEPPAAGDHGRTPEEERNVPPDPLLSGNGFVDMMDTEQQIVDDPLDDVEQNPAEFLVAAQV